MGRYIWQKLTCLFIVILLASPFPTFANAEESIRICTEPGDQCYPAISGSRIVWQDYRNGSGVSDIFLYDTDTNSEMPITQGPGFQYGPAIQGDRVVWVEDDFPGSAIMLYNITTQASTQLTNISYGAIGFLKIYEDIIAWNIFTHEGGDNICYYDIRTGNVTQLTDSGQAQHPDVYENYIVWFEYRNYQRYDIFLYDIASGEETQITNDSELQTKPSVYRDKIVWVDYRNADSMNESGESDVYMYDLTHRQETRLTKNGFHYSNPVICGDIVVWNKNERTNCGLYAYNFTSRKETLLLKFTGDMDYVEYFDMDQNKVVWSQTVYIGDSNIYMISLPKSSSIWMLCGTAMAVAVCIAVFLVYWYVRRRPPQSSQPPQANTGPGNDPAGQIPIN